MRDPLSLALADILISHSAPFISTSQYHRVKAGSPSTCDLTSALLGSPLEAVSPQAAPRDFLQKKHARPIEIGRA
jgi:hypothetical protein